LRGGTTWLHELLACHPDIYVPTRRKEIFFFDLHYERGLEWYEGFFPNDVGASRYKAIGEITATYIYRTRSPKRIAGVPSIKKLILSVRNPADRAYSWYGLMVKEGQYSGPFEEFLQDRPQVLEKGFYSQYLESYYRYFGRDQILVLIYERATADIPRTKIALAELLGVAPGGFPPDAGARRVNRSYAPRFASAYAWARKVAWHDLRYRWNLDWVVNVGKRLGVERIFGEAGPLPAMAPETRQHLSRVYEEDIGRLELLLETDLECWR
jgi:hypothetical protein